MQKVKVVSEGIQGPFQMLEGEWVEATNTYGKKFCKGVVNSIQGTVEIECSMPFRYACLEANVESGDWFQGTFNKVSKRWSVEKLDTPHQGQPSPPPQQKQEPKAQPSQARVIPVDQIVGVAQRVYGSMVEAASQGGDPEMASESAKSLTATIMIGVIDMIKAGWALPEANDGELPF